MLIEVINGVRAALPANLSLDNAHLSERFLDFFCRFFIDDGNQDSIDSLIQLTSLANF